MTGACWLDTTPRRLACRPSFLATGLRLTEPAAGTSFAQRMCPLGRRLWPRGAADYRQAEHPISDPAFEFLVREGGRAVGQSHSLFSLCGQHEVTEPISGDIPAISIGAERAAQGAQALCRGGL